jgi:cytochrome c oxidase assembly factor CtaG/putative copper export protein
MTQTHIETDAVPTGGRWPLRLAWPVVAAAGSAAVLVAVLRFGGGVDGRLLPGLPNPGALTNWGLPAVRTVADLAGALTVGCGVTAAFLLPGSNHTLGPAGYRLLRRTAGAAVVWLVAVVAEVILTVSDLLGQPVTVLSGQAVASFVTSISAGQALAVQAVLAANVAVLAGSALSRTGAATAAVLAVAAVLPPAFTGHAAGAGNHQIAVTSLAIHVVAASLWAGGLAALLMLRGDRLLPGAARRYSRLALACWIAVVASGVANAWVRLGEWNQLWDSRYGVLVGAKAVALVVLGGFGAVHRWRTLPRLVAGTGGAFRRLAAVEVSVFAATVGLAVGLSRTPTPVPRNPANPDPVTDLVGFPMPAAPNVARMLGEPLPDMFFLAIVAVGIGSYLTGVWRLRQAGHRWPWPYTACWLAGMLLLAVATNLGFARYAYVLFSAHMAQHMILSMAVPILLVCGAPLTLALRALRRPSEPGVRGARDWLLIVIRSRLMRLLSHPLVALGIYVVSLFALYLTPLLGVLMRFHLGHLAMLTHFVLAGYLLFWVLIGVDPGRRRLSPALLIVIHFLAMAFHAFLGLILLQSRVVMSQDWYSAVHPSWAAPLLTDQRLAAGIAWAFGEIPASVVMAVLVVQWIRADEREQRRVDRAADRAAALGVDDDLARYNAFLAAARKEP